MATISSNVRSGRSATRVSIHSECFSNGELLPPRCPCQATSFGGDVDYAMLVKIYGPTSEHAVGRYSPAECIGARKERIEGNPDPKHVSTSYAERNNLNVRM